jgi:amidophosphoribosyltransferase
MGDGLKESCGVFGIYGHPSAAYLTYRALQALQHRGQESCGIVSSDGFSFYERIRMGLVAENFKKEHFPGINGNGEALKGHLAVGHTRYSTTGNSSIKNAQPLVLDIKYGKIALAHNGNLTNGLMLREQLKRRGADFKSTTDSEVVGHLIAHSKSETLDDAIGDALQQLEGAYSLVIASPQSVYAARDPNGFRPLSIGYVDDAVVVASESCAFDMIDATLVRDVRPGELITMNADTLQTDDRFAHHWFVPKSIVKPALCLFELVYFARPDSVIHGVSVARVRQEMGRRLYEEYPVDADIVIPVPDSGNNAAIGFSHASKIPYTEGFVRNHYVHRTFINPDSNDRRDQARMKLNVVKDLVAGKRAVVVDDSVVRGTTARSRVSILKDCGAKEVHLRVSCPPHKNGCYYGIDFPDSNELIAATHSLNEIRDFVGANSLGYLSIEGALAAAKNVADGYCTACWTGKYPTSLVDIDKGLVSAKKC